MAQPRDGYDLVITNAEQVILAADENVFSSECQSCINRFADVVRGNDVEVDSVIENNRFSAAACYVNFSVGCDWR